MQRAPAGEGLLIFKVEIGLFVRKRLSGIFSCLAALALLLYLGTNLWSVRHRNLSPNGAERSKPFYGPLVVDTRSIMGLGQKPFKTALTSDFKQVQFYGVGKLEFNETLGLYTLDFKPIIWLFWDYARLPAYIALAIKSIQCHNAATTSIVILNDGLIKEHFGADLSPTYEYLIPVHKSDYVRCLLLYRYGGMWLDVDTIALEPMDQLFADLKNGYDLIGYTWPPENAPLGIGAIGPARSNLSLFRTWKRIVDSKLEARRPRIEATYRDPELNPYPIGWGGILSDILQPLMKTALAKSTIKYRSLDGPETWGQLDKYSRELNHYFPIDNFDDGNTSFLETLRPIKRTELLLLHNSMLSEEIKGLSISQLLESKILLARILNASLSRCLSERLNFANLARVDIATADSLSLIYKLIEHADYGVVSGNAKKQPPRNLAEYIMI